MKTLTKAKRFMERMDNVENMSERQLTEMVFRAATIIAEYVETEDKKERAYVALKEATKYKSIKKETKEKEVKTVNISKQVINQLKTETKLVVMKEDADKGMIMGCYNKDGVKNYFSCSNKYSHPVIFNSPALTSEIKEAILKDMPNFFNPITKQLKEVSLFSKIGNNHAMVHLVDAKRQVFEGYIGDMLFSTTAAYIDKGYKPLVTKANDFIVNGGKHNHVADNICTNELKVLIVSLINTYKTTSKYTKANRDVEYINSVKTVKQEVKEPVRQSYGYNLYDIAKQPESVTIGGGDYEPIF